MPEHALTAMFNCTRRRLPSAAARCTPCSLFASIRVRTGQRLTTRRADQAERGRGEAEGGAQIASRDAWRSERGNLDRQTRRTAQGGKAQDKVSGAPRRPLSLLQGSLTYLA